MQARLTDRHSSQSARLGYLTEIPTGYMPVEQLVPVACELSGSPRLLADPYVPKLLCNESSGISRCEKCKATASCPEVRAALERDRFGAKWPVLKVFDNISAEGGRVPLLLKSETRNPTS